MARPAEGLGAAFSMRLPLKWDEAAREERAATGKPLSQIVRTWLGELAAVRRRRAKEERRLARLYSGAGCSIETSVLGVDLLADGDDSELVGAVCTEDDEQKLADVLKHAEESFAGADDQYPRVQQDPCPMPFPTERPESDLDG